MIINHRYLIREKLGGGGSGEVFRCEDLCKKSRQVAVKILHPAATEEDDTFQNEVSSLVGLQHPNLIRIFDFGKIRHSGVEALLLRRFFTMELIHGVDSLSWMKTVSGFKDRQAVLEPLLLQALSVLAYIHREGLVHFDIKPQNFLLVGESGSAAPVLKLTDFGFATKQGEVGEVSLRGTLEYSAPEFLAGSKTSDHRIDLYSLGATFFHLLEGRCPFEAGTPVELVKKILTEEPVFSSKPANSTSRLREVIRGLLHRDPSRRFNTAEAAARALTANLPEGDETLESYFGFSRKSRFVGRKNEREILETAMEVLGNWMRTGEAAIVLSGVEGIGKSSVLHHALRFARLREIQVYDTEAIHTDVPFDGIAGILNVLVADVRSMSDRGEELFQKYDALIGFTRDEPGRSELWGRTRANMVELISRFIGECSELFPVIIAIDDAQYLDRASVEVLRMTVRDAVSGRCLVLAAETTESVVVFPPPAARELRLREMGQGDVVQMSSSLFGEGKVARDIGEAVYSLYGGTPGIVIEALRAVDAVLPGNGLDDPEVARAFISSIESKLPRTIDDFFVSRFNKLSRERQLIVSVLSCFEFPAKPSVVVTLLPFHRQRTADHLRFLQLDGIVGEVENERSLFIRMKRLKDTVYDRIKADRSELHKLIAEELEAGLRNSVDFFLLQELAFQYAGSSDNSRAGQYYEAAADEGSKLFALHRTLHLYREAIAAAQREENPRRERALKVKFAAALFKAGMYREAIEIGEETTSSGDLEQNGGAAIFKVMGLSLSRLGESDRAQEYLKTALELSLDDIEQLELRQELVGIQISGGHLKSAEDECLQQLERAKGLNLEGLTGAIYTDLGIATFFQNRFDFAADCFSEALRRYEALNEKTQIINSMNNIGNALSAKGDFTAATAYWERALRASQDYGTLNQQAQIQNNLGIAHYNMKRFDKAKQFYIEARIKYERLDSKIGLAFSLTNLGEVMFAEGEYEAALNRWKEAKELYTSMEHPQARTESCLHLANVLSRLGDYEEMKKELDEAKALIDAETLDTFVGRYYYLSGILQYGEGNYKAAEDSFKQAVAVYEKENAREALWLSAIRLADCSVRRGKCKEAAECVCAVLENTEAAKVPAIVAEADYLMGCIGSLNPSAVPEKSIMYFKRGIEALVREPVNETTWKLAFALAQEYYERGQRERAKEFLVKTRLILQFFLSHFTSAKLKKKYLDVDQKEQVFATIETIIQSKE